jgi:predicted phosphodiesterase
MQPFRFVVIADSHIRFPDDGVAEYPSNALMADRNRYVVDLCNRIAPDLIVHLGDIVHPLPTEQGHEAAIRLAVDVYDGLEAPIHYVPGNHDIGDKPDSLVAVAPVAAEHYRLFETYWGRPFGSFDHDDCHFVMIDTPVLGSGLDGDDVQRSWLEKDLAKADGRRVFLFTHYPPFVHHRGEAEHYDNLAAAPRQWLLDLCSEHRVEAVFSGHVHNYILNHHEDTALYVLPATGFVRPDYSEMAALAPEREGGRDEIAKLGLFVVEVTGEGHDILPVRTFGRTSDSDAIDLDILTQSGWRAPLGVTLRHGWASTHDLPTDGLDEFRRKTVRNDYPLLALAWPAEGCDSRCSRRANPIIRPWRPSRNSPR